MKVLNKYKYHFVTFILFGILIEFGAYISLVITGSSPKDTYQSVYKSVVPGQVTKNQYTTGWSKIRPHPYFGFVLKDGNNHGFSNDFDFPLEKTNEDYVIAIFGGSVAWSFASSTEGIRVLVEYLKKKVSFLKNKKVRILNLAMGAHKQPQAFFISTYYSSMYNLAINLDGWNEIQPRKYHSTKIYNSNENVSEALPAFTEIFFSSSQETYLSLGKKAFLSSILSSVALKIWKSDIISKSSFVYLCWELFRKVLNYLEDDEDNYNAYLKKSNINVTDETQFLYRQTRNWSRYVQLQASSLSAVGVESAYFIQPNHHYRNSKPIAKGEHFSQATVSRVNKAYDLLSNEVDKLKKIDINAFKIFNVFKNEKSIIYNDDCHVNETGNYLLGKLIAKKLVENNVIRPD
jgi:hypothetical protein